jgi:hypothetical protein
MIGASEEFTIIYSYCKFVGDVECDRLGSDISSSTSNPYCLSKFR